MQLRNLNQNFQMLSPNEQAVFFSSYRSRRQKDLDQVIIKLQTKKRRSTGSGKGKKIPVTVEQLDLLKKLGLI